jgi:hypothetical protein
MIQVKCAATLDVVGGCMRAPIMTLKRRRKSFEGGVEEHARKEGSVGWGHGRWRSNPHGKCSQERLAWGTVASTMHREAHPFGCARCGAGAGCSPMKYNLFEHKAR